MTIVEFMKENELAWQPSFSGDLSGGLYGYRGAMIVEAGKQISPDRKLPPKIQAKQVVMVSEGDVVKFLACELESIEHFEPFYTKYKSFFVADGLYLLYVTDLDKSGTFEFESITFTAFPLDESSVWNELVDLADLDKGDLKKMSSEEKIEAIYDELQNTDCKESSKTFEEVLASKGESSKKLMGAV